MAGMNGFNNGGMAGWRKQTSHPKSTTTLALQSQVYHCYRRSSSAKILSEERLDVPDVHNTSREMQRYLVRALVASEEEGKIVDEAQSSPVEQEVEGEQRG